jgi:hypothetical protein
MWCHDGQIRNYVLPGCSIWGRIEGGSIASRWRHCAQRLESLWNRAQIIVRRWKQKWSYWNFRISEVICNCCEFSLVVHCWRSIFWNCVYPTVNGLTFGPILSTLLLLEKEAGMWLLEVAINIVQRDSAFLFRGRLWDGKIQIWSFL